MEADGLLLVLWFCIGRFDMAWLDADIALNVSRVTVGVEELQTAWGPVAGDFRRMRADPSVLCVST